MRPTLAFRQARDITTIKRVQAPDIDELAPDSAR